MDAGNFATLTETFQPWERTSFVWDMMAYLGYDVVTPGDLELMEGIDSLRTLMSRHPEVEVVSANLQDVEGAKIFPEYTVIEKNGLRVGITGVTGGSYYRHDRLGRGPGENQFTFEDERNALQRVVPRLEEESDLVVGLLHVGPGDVRRIIKDIPGFDVVVVGHNPGYMFSPDTVGSTLILQPGSRGQYLSVLDLIVDTATDSLFVFSGEARPLGDGVEKDPEVDAIVSKWEDDFSARRKGASRTARQAKKEEKAPS
jgi:2',3'-cyclic-nucleotide 2'-phosphodiesterase (5'-nucleotidase family)